MIRLFANTADQYNKQLSTNLAPECLQILLPDRHILAAYHNKRCWRAFRGYQHRWPWTTL